MLTRYSPYVLALFVCAGWSVPALAQTAPAPGGVTPSVSGALGDLAFTVSALPVGAALERATALEVANTPFGSSAGGFVFKVDPATGLTVRTAPTFGPSFAERALTAGEGKVTFGASLGVATYDRLNDFSLRQMQLTKLDGVNADNQLTGLASLVLSSETLVVSSALGATDNLDIAVVVPFVKVKLDGLAWVETSDERVVDFLSREISSSGLGDIGVSAKYRLLKFGEDLPDPGGVAVQLVTRMPTGSRDNLRGLGITRVLGSVLVSAGTGRLRPHANVGFDWWEKGLVFDQGFSADFPSLSSVEARHQVQYAAGVELEARPKVTLLVDVLGRHVLGGGAVAAENVPVPTRLVPNVTSVDIVLATPTALRKLTLAPGLKWNIKGSLVFSGSALIPLRDNGLHDLFTPVVGLDWTF